jgi:hypothetical protein
MTSIVGVKFFNVQLQNPAISGFFCFKRFLGITKDVQVHNFYKLIFDKVYCFYFGLTEIIDLKCMPFNDESSFVTVNLNGINGMKPHFLGGPFFPIEDGSAVGHCFIN